MADGLSPRSGSVLLAALLALGTCAFLWQSSRDQFGIDFFHYWLVPQLSKTTAPADIYASDEQQASLLEKYRGSLSNIAGKSTRFESTLNVWKIPQITGTPFFYAALATLIGDNYDASLTRYQLLSTVAFVCGVVLLLLLLGGSLGDISLTLAWVSFANAAISSDIRTANVNRILFCWLLAYAALKHVSPNLYRLVAAGALLGGAVAFKPILVFVPFTVLLFEIVCARNRAAAYEAVGVITGGALAVLCGTIDFGGFTVWAAWLERLSTLEWQRRYTLEMGNYSLVNILLQHGVKYSSVLTPVLLLSLLLGACLRGRTALKQMPSLDITLSGVSVGILLYLLSSRLGWLHYFTLAVIPTLYVFFRCAVTPSRAVFALVAAVALSLDPVARLFALESPLLMASIINGGACLLYLLLLLHIAQGIPRASQP